MPQEVIRNYHPKVATIDLDLLYMIISMRNATLYYYRFIDLERSVLGEYSSTLPREIASIRRFTLHTYL